MQVSSICVAILDFRYLNAKPRTHETSKTNSLRTANHTRIQVLKLVVLELLSHIEDRELITSLAIHRLFSFPPQCRRRIFPYYLPDWIFPQSTAVHPLQWYNFTIRLPLELRKVPHYPRFFFCLRIFYSSPSP